MDNEQLDNTKAQMRKGFLEFCILLLLAKREEVYPSDILTELKNVQLLVVEGTLYPLLSRLQRAGLVAYRWEESTAGPPRKYYRLTEQGRASVVELQKTWAGLVSAVQLLSTTV
jgi:PadR family transcriptional regulator PadR